MSGFWKFGAGRSKLDNGNFKFRQNAVVFYNYDMYWDLRNSGHQVCFKSI